MAGSVVDPTGLPVAGAEIIVTSQAKGAVVYQGKTTDTGAFLVPSLQFGLYKVEVRAESFKSAVVSNIKVDAGAQVAVSPIKLELGPVTETVTVEASGVNIQTTNAQLTDTVEKKQVDNLPLLNRNPLALLGLQAGVVSGNYARTVTVINGQRPSLSNVTLDGVNIQDNFIRSNSLDFLPNLPLLSQVAEFTVSTQNAGPETGFGASQISIVTPSGTNDWHMDGFWYHRNNALAANTWFNNASGVKKPFLLQNQLGGSIGGPIMKNKLFVYGYYELFRLRQQSAQQHTLITDAARTGLFTYIPTCTTATCPVGVTPGVARTFNILAARLNSVGATIGPFTIDPLMAQTLQQVPIQSFINNYNTGDSKSTQLLNTAGYQFNKRNNRTRDNYGVKVDYNLSSKHSFSGTWSWNRDIVDRPDLDGAYTLVPLVDNNDQKKLLAVTWRWSPTNRLTNEVRGGLNFAPASFNVYEDFSAGRLFTGQIFTNPMVTFRAQGRRTDTYTLQDNASWALGSHFFKFGFFAQEVRVTAYNEAGISPSYALGISAANNIGMIGGNFLGGISSSDLSRANSLFQTLSGYLTSGTQTFNAAGRTTGYVSGAASIRRPRLWNLAGYFGDTWRFHKNVTLTYGVRYDYYGRLWEKNGMYLQPIIPDGSTVFDVLKSNAAFDFAGGPEGRPLNNADVNNWGPGIGIAWDPFGDGKMAVRAGYSIHYVNDEAIRGPENAGTGNMGLSTTASVISLAMTMSGSVPTISTPTFLMPRTAQDNFNVSNIPQTIWLIDPNLRTPYVQEWNLSVQRDIGWSTMVEVRYMGNSGTGLYRGIDFNQVIIGSNAFLADFLRARSNGFLALAATGTFNPAYNAAISGSQPLTVLTTFLSSGYLTSSTVRNYIQTGQVGDLAYWYHSNNYYGTSTVPLVANKVASVADLITNLSHSTYHAGVVEVRRRFSRSLGFQANYTWSKVLTDSSGEGQTKFEPFLDNANPRADRARATFDTPHAFKANFVYEFPFGRGRRWAPGNAALEKVVSGWNVSSVFTWQSGSPFSILSARGTLNRAGRSGMNTVNSNLTAEQLRNFIGVFKRPGAVYVIDPQLIASTGLGVGSDTKPCDYTSFTGQAFCNPEPGLLGTLQRMQFNGPVVFAWDFAASKQTGITERLKFEYRAEFFNIMNHPVFWTGDQSVNSTNFGKMTSNAVGRRIIQMTIRLLW
jgi:hypothetical protein